MTGKPYSIEWRPMALDDLREIVRYIGKDNQVRAKSFVRELREKTKHLATNPEIGKRGRPGLPEWLRELIAHPNYIVFYRVLEDTKVVEIVRVKHVAQQIP